jgi:endonuclease/exonuclease/phosphatase family metal-dependent hydrolase
VHWNTQWGGTRGERSLAEIVAALHTLHPDLICLSEAPSHAQLTRAWAAHGKGAWSSVSIEQPDTFTRYWYRLTVMSRYPVQARQQWTLPTGHAVLFEVALPTRTLRILMVDLQSAPTKPRSPSIAEAARIVDELARTGTLIDLVVGDFNTPGRFVGVDALAASAAGYRRAALWSGQWRATWPSHVLLSPFDIDHIWVRQGLAIAASEIFRNQASDHRGQATVLRLPAAPNAGVRFTLRGGVSAER